MNLLGDLIILYGGFVVGFAILFCIVAMMCGLENLYDKVKKKLAKKE